MPRRIVLGKVIVAMVFSLNGLKAEMPYGLFSLFPLLMNAMLKLRATAWSDLPEQIIDTQKGVTIEDHGAAIKLVTTIVRLGVS